MSRLLLLIPAFNEEKMIGRVLKNIPKKINKIKKIETLVIDDGSSDKTAKIASQYKIIIIKHLINRGLGASLATGFTYARLKNFDYLVTFDADGQHDVSEIHTLVSALMQKRVDVVIGSRLLTISGMPFARRVINYLSNVATWILFKTWTSDSQSGLRAFNNNAINKIKIRSQRMEVSSEIFKEIKSRKLTLAEVPIKAIYTQYSLRKGQPISNASNVIIKLILNQFT